MSPGREGAGPPPDTGAPTVLFVCVHNAGRSQMAAAFLAREAEGAVRVLSAGSEPASALNPAVLAVMAEVGLDLSERAPRVLTDEDAHSADVVVTMGCHDACPTYPGTRRLDWDLPDPAGRPVEEVRVIRDEIERLVQSLSVELLSDRSTRPESREAAAPAPPG